MYTNHRDTLVQCRMNHQPGTTLQSLRATHLELSSDDWQPDPLTVEQMHEWTDDTVFRQILTNLNHVLAHLLPEKVNTHYQLRPCRQHDRQLIPKTTKLYSCNFVIRMLYKHSYWLYFIVYSLPFLLLFLLLSYIVQVAFWQLDIKRRWWWWWWVTTLQG